ncbi:GTPase [Marchantia polymorpha subsp. ruderalis]
MMRMGFKSCRVSRTCLRLFVDRGSELLAGAGGPGAFQEASIIFRENGTTFPRAGVTELAAPIPWRSAGAGRCVRGFRSSASGAFWNNDDDEPPRLLVVQPRLHPLPVLKAKLLEALRLADSLEDPRNVDKGKKQRREPSPYVLVQNPSNKFSRKSPKRMHAGAYFGPGTIENVLAHVHVASTKGRLDAIFVNAPLSGVQQRNLENAWGKPVLDRVGLIIEIFGAHAQSKAAKLQVELASLNYYRSRLVRARGKAGARLGFGAGGESEVVSARGRATGAIGGAGETEIQLQRRRILTRKTRLKALLAEVDRTQTLHRAARTREGITPGQGKSLPVVAVVGYTNAGKSSLVAALSRSDMYVDDKLFATLDTRSRRVVLPSGKKVILSDTVGFISDLPIQLVEAFQATLNEVVEADYLLHVIDSSAANASEQRETVLEVLQQIGVSRHKMENCMIEVWNKSDLSGKEFEITQSEDLPEGAVKNTLSEVLSTEADGLDMAEDSLVTHPLKMEHTDIETLSDGAELLDLEWAREGVSCVSTSVRTKTGLAELLRLLDRKIQSDWAEEGLILSEENLTTDSVEKEIVR